MNIAYKTRLELRRSPPESFRLEKDASCSGPSQSDEILSEEAPPVKAQPLHELSGQLGSMLSTRRGRYAIKGFAIRADTLLDVQIRFRMKLPGRLGSLLGPEAFRDH